MSLSNNCSVSLISIRPISLLDTASIVRWRNQPAVNVNLFSQDVLTEEQHIKYMKEKVFSGKCSQYIIVQESESFRQDIGTIFIKNIDYKNRKGELGIFIGEEIARGKGLAKYAVKCILEKAFNELQLHRVYLSVIEDNIPAIKTYLEQGFQIEGRLRADYYSNGIFKDVILMGIIKEEWLQAEHILH